MSHSRGLLLRILPRSTLTSPAVPRRLFSTTSPAFVNRGDAIPDLDLVEGSPGNKVNLAKELKGKGLIIGVPAAFSTYIFKIPGPGRQGRVHPSTCVKPLFVMTSALFFGSVARSKHTGSFWCGLVSNHPCFSRFPFHALTWPSDVQSAWLTRHLLTQNTRTYLLFLLRVLPDDLVTRHDPEPTVS